jgi:hypothetical protein
MVGALGVGAHEGVDLGVALNIGVGGDPGARCYRIQKPARQNFVSAKSRKFNIN